MIVFAWVILWLTVMTTLSFLRMSLSVWTTVMAIFLLLCTLFSPFGMIALSLFWFTYALIFIPLNIRTLRYKFLTKIIFRQYKKMMPALSDTEREALTAGNVAWEGDLFSGIPDWNKLHALSEGKLTTEERAFLEGPVETLCSMINSWKMNYEMNLPQQILQFLRENGLLAMIIPKQYGGLGFSHFAHAQIITKIASASCVAGILTSVPNSLGPAELLLHYGTEDQKNRYLPRLAKGEDIPCFALTSPIAGSDAGSIEDYGVVCETEFEGKKQLCIRLNWDKRYITLAPVATLIGLAFKLYDPDHLLGNKESLGITCALIPSHLPNIDIGRRHMPLVSAFPNGPVRGKDVIVPIDAIIGGIEMAGQGWRMLMECLAAGRSISLPSMVTGGARLGMLATGAYSRIRRQFNMPIAQFGGVEEALTRIGAYVYMMEALRLFTVSRLDEGKRPAVASAISKYHCTEMARRVISDAMDIHGGKGICMGPSNYLAQGHIESPIAVTVEGANILTRSMIIFGQGAVRCHPYVFSEMTAAQNTDSTAGLIAFDEAIFAHMGFIISNKARAWVLGITNGRLVSAPQGSLKRYYQQLSRFSASFAYLADIVMITMGAELKRAEKISSRFSDILSYLYIASAVLKHYQECQSPAEDLPVVQWVCEDLLYKIQIQIDGLLCNLPNRWVARFCRIVVFPLGRRLRAPNDCLGAKVAKLMTEPTGFRERLARDIYYTPNENNPAAQLEKTLEMTIAAEPIEKQLMSAFKDHRIQGKTRDEWITSALDRRIISSKEAELLNIVFAAKMRAIHVDDFPSSCFETRNVKDGDLILG